MSEHVMVPDAITPVVGWRAWLTDPVALYSVNHAYRWEPGTAAKSSCPIEPKAPQQRMIPLPPTFGGYTPYSPPRYEEESPSVFAARRVAWQRSHRSLMGQYRPATGEHLLDVCEGVSLWHPAPRIRETLSAVDTCSCGFYAANGIAEAIRYTTTPTSIVGRVALWGRVVVYTGGFRGEFAYPQSLFVRDDASRAVAERYGVPVLSWDQLPEHAPLSEQLRATIARLNATTAALTGRVSRPAPTPKSRKWLW